MGKKTRMGRMIQAQPCGSLSWTNQVLRVGHGLKKPKTNTNLHFAFLISLSKSHFLLTLSLLFKNTHQCSSTFQKTTTKPRIRWLLHHTPPSPDYCPRWPETQKAQKRTKISRFILIDPLNVDLGLASSKNTLRALDLNPKSRQKTLQTPLFRHHDSSRFLVCSPSSLNLPSLKTPSPKIPLEISKPKISKFPFVLFLYLSGLLVA